MNIRDHTPDISRGVRGFRRGRILDALEIVDGGVVEIERISLIERVNFAALRYLDIGMSEHELSKCGIECVTVDTVTRREDEVRRRTIPSRECSDASTPLARVCERRPTSYSRQQPFHYQASRHLQLCHANLISNSKDELSASCMQSARGGSSQLDIFQKLCRCLHRRRCCYFHQVDRRQRNTFPCICLR
jgi:hypothetical protein